MILIKYKIDRDAFCVMEWDEIIDGPFSRELISEVMSDPDSKIVWAKQIDAEGKIVWENRRTK